MTPDMNAGEIQHSCRVAEEDPLYASRGRPPRFFPASAGFGLYFLAPEAPFLGEFRPSSKQFWRCRACLGYGLAPTSKKPCATLWLDGLPNKYQGETDFFCSTLISNNDVDCRRD